MGSPLSKRVLAFATTQAAWAEKLRAVASAHGWQAVSSTEPGALLRLVPSGHGVLIADCEALCAPGQARRWVSHARKKEGFSVVLAGAPADFGAGLSRLLSAGADDLIERTIADKDLARRLAHLGSHHAPVSAFLEAPTGGVRVDVSRGKVFLSVRDRWKEAAALSPKEFALLRCFLENPGEVLERSRLLHFLWPDRADRVNAETVDKHVGDLRRKLGPNGRLITTVYGAGYRLG